MYTQKHVSLSPSSLNWNLASPDASQILDYLQGIHNQVEQLQQNVDRLQMQVGKRRTVLVQASPFMTADHHSPMVKLVFVIIRLFFLLVVGFGLVCMLSVALKAEPMTEMLFQLMAAGVAPVVALVVCAIAIAVIAEAMK